ncbi:phospho-N-acetylmuramoyl-pentapeptide-transferase [Deferribacter desulfuricans SSM1]|uniref:Phospho-N-acetylmuramoyl-pentapeptide-transferase n=1 Tax=Deferribacter desulfuricans (strain DSM 14783 / JCM 11476 / NBRC 101012 / SSM1) TaxID=639282 RepID=D3PBV2_DEFDS|nr:phospho-N-acetylmuramoyl-pentapeptide-transferase [Deferribacter desulfuricans]BAI80075.1 phospho-N-acetylmuramoyl-pentapeptide-transferase [Deferribacter desulfuricans SSM1]
MLYNLLYPLSEHFILFNVFKYITFRTIYAIITSFIIAIVFGPKIIKQLKTLQISQKTKGYEPERHKEKEGTPTMGGLLIILSCVVSTLLWADLRNYYVWIVLYVFICTAAIGLFDDYIKTIKKNPEGLSPKSKFLAQVVVAVTTTILIIWVDKSNIATKLYFPFFKHLIIDLSYFYILFAVFIIVGTSNAVNLTDGLDGLAIMPTVISFGTFILFTYLAGHIKFSNYLHIPYVAGSGELAIFCGSMVGAGLGFLWFNAFPASVFMGDVGSLSIGSALGTVAIIVKQEIVLAIVGGVFVIETLSVILQVGFFKATKGKRLFRMAPIHHHYELKGWSEPKIIVRFWIVSFLLALLALSTLKLR